MKRNVNRKAVIDKESISMSHAKVSAMKRSAKKDVAVKKDVAAKKDIASKESRTSIDLVAKHYEIGVSALIDSYLNTLYANDITGYMVENHALFRSQAAKSINEKLQSLDAPTRRLIKQGFEYRLSEFDKFHELPEKRRKEIISLARSRHVLPEQAYEDSSKRETA